MPLPALPLPAPPLPPSVTPCREGGARTPRATALPTPRPPGMHPLSHRMYVPSAALLPPPPPSPALTGWGKLPKVPWRSRCWRPPLLGHGGVDGARPLHPSPLLPSPRARQPFMRLLCWVFSLIPLMFIICPTGLTDFVSCRAARPRSPPGCQGAASPPRHRLIWYSARLPAAFLYARQSVLMEDDCRSVWRLFGVLWAVQRVPCSLTARGCRGCRGSLSFFPCREEAAGEGSARTAEEKGRGLCENGLFSLLS